MLTMFSLGNYLALKLSGLIYSKPYVGHAMQTRAHWKKEGYSGTMWTPYPLTIRAWITPLQFPVNR
jgi:hypothetical protein